MSVMEKTDSPRDTADGPGPRAPLREAASLYLMIFLSLATAANLWITARLSWRIENINWEVHYRRQIARLQEENAPMKVSPARQPARISFASPEPAKEPSKINVLSPEEEFKHLTLSDVLLGLADSPAQGGKPTINLTFEQGRDIGKLLPEIRHCLAGGDPTLQNAVLSRLKALLFRDQLLVIDRVRREYGDKPRNDGRCLAALMKSVQAVRHAR